MSQKHNLDLSMLSEQIVENLEFLLQFFGYEYIKYYDRISLSCPIHGSDNSESLSIFLKGRTQVGNWVCWTNHCEIDNSGIYGLLMRLLEIHYGEEFTFPGTLDWICEQLDVDSEAMAARGDAQDKLQFISMISEKPTKKKQIPDQMREEFVSKLRIPAEYFLNRGYSEETLKYFDVGYGDVMPNRAIAPVYDITGTYVVGCQGRSILPECEFCHRYHDRGCPIDRKDKKNSAKWLCSDGFTSSHYLYNMWNAAEEIEKTGVVILVEGPADVWKLYEAGFLNCVAVFGSSLSESQTLILQKTPANTIITAFDNDDAGKSCAKKVENKLSRMYNIDNIVLEHGDVGDTPVEILRNLIKV